MQDSNSIMQGYIEAAIFTGSAWSLIGDSDNPEPLDSIDHNGFSPASLIGIRSIAARFWEHKQIAIECFIDATKTDYATVGRLLLLTRDGHGSGFSVDYPDMPAAQILAEYAKGLGESYTEIDPETRELRHFG